MGLNFATPEIVPQIRFWAFKMDREWGWVIGAVVQIIQNVDFIFVMISDWQEELVTRVLM